MLSLKIKNLYEKHLNTMELYVIIVPIKPVCD